MTPQPPNPDDACLGALQGAAASPRTLREEIIQRAQTKVQRILHYRWAATVLHACM